ncbi:MAG: FKBP-type peptidyl-prolyl cis-trans isomerase [Solirubrobacterales bacterium]
MSSPRPRLLVLLAVSATAAFGAGCGGDDNSGSATTDTAPTETQATQPTTTPEQPEAPQARKVKPAAGEGDPDRKPKVPKGKGDSPTELVVQDLIVGKGERAKSGDTVSVQYVGVLFDNGKQFDASWNGNRPGQAFQFPLGGGQVIPGWDQGVVGMREGGRRKLIIPSDLAYGAQGFPPDIPPNAPLIFDIDLEQIS